MNEQTGSVVIERDPEQLIKPAVLHHVFFKTRNLDEMIEFYGLVIGATPRARGPEFAFLSFDEANHRIALFTNDAFRDPLQGEEALLTCGLDHVGYEYSHLDELLHTYIRLKRHGLEPYWTVNHGPTMSFYYRDPDGNGVELQVDNMGHDPARWQAFLQDGRFHANPAGVNVDPEKLIEARREGADPDDIGRRSYEGGYS